MRAKLLLFFVIFMPVISEMVQAKNLGVYGQTYPIIEEDFLEFIQKRIETMKQNGELKKLENQMRDIASKKANRPQPVINITRTQKNKTWFFDPSIKVPYDLKDHNGKTFAKAGTTFNPLSMVSLHKTLLFYDADDVDQLHWVDKKISDNDKLILVRGSISQESKRLNELKKPIYFDQEGRLTSRFSIKHVPAIVRQEGMKLKIEEVVP